MKTGLRVKETKQARADVVLLGVAEFAALMKNFAPFTKPPRIAAAISGGPDSMALAFCAQRWIEEQGGELIALIVDHALRRESADEAKQTQMALAKIGIRSEILRWQHPPVVSKLHETARRARYRLLTEACRRYGVNQLLFAHHSQDQAETILMRLAKGSGVDGLAGMAWQGRIDGIDILRPFLSTARERLAATCGAAGLPFISDPSNNAIKYARGRLRRILPLLAEEGLTVDRLNDLGARAAEAKAALDHATAMLLRVGGKLDDGGVIHLNLEHVRSAPQAIARRALMICLQTIHPENYGPEYASLARLADALAADGEMPACTLHGCFISKSETEIVIMREYAAITEELPIKPGECVTWDNRWQVTLRADAGDSFFIRPLGNPPHEVLHKLATGLRRQIRQGRVRATLPSLWLNGVLALIPALPRSFFEANAEAKPAFNWPPTPGR